MKINSYSGQEILLLAASDRKFKTHYWYVNENFLKKFKPGEKVFFIQEEKVLKITCLDENGRDGSVKVSIKYY